MTVVYIDLLFLLNLVANYLLLLGTGRVAGVSLRRWRIGLGAGLGAVYAVLLFLPNLEWLSLWPCKILSGILMPLIAYGGERSLLRVIALFFAGSAGLAGLVLAVELLGGAGLTLENGVLYSAFDLRLLLFLFVICYFVMSLFFRRIGRHGSREVVSLTIEIYGKSVAMTALLDSGHTLTDPVDNRPVIVADFASFAELLPPGIDPAQAVEAIKRCRTHGVSGVRLIPYRAVGVDCGMLLAIKAQNVIVNGRKLGSLLVVLSPNPVDDGGGYQALIGGI